MKLWPGLMCVLACQSAVARADLYTLKAADLMAEPRSSGKVVQALDANETLTPLGDQAAGGWFRVQVGKFSGFVDKGSVSRRRIEVHKRQRQLLVLDDETVVARYPVALGADAPVGDKQRQGDRATPEGRFFLAALDERPDPNRYGARSLLISYPSAAHARRGLAAKLIDQRAYNRIVKQVRQGQVPDQRTRLGGSIRIHGGGAGGDWTLGCVALADSDVADLFDKVSQGTRVDVFASAEAAAATSWLLPAAIVEGAQSQLNSPAYYSELAMGYSSLAYPNGDIAAGHAVCSDIAIRALRHAGVDLQSLVWEDRLRRPNAYSGVANWSIDHRRVRNLVTFLDRWADPIAGRGPSDFAAGDIVVFDTGVSNGTAFDHIGVVSQTRGEGFPPVVNIWAPGQHTSHMALLGQSYPTVVNHYRITGRMLHW